MNKRRRLPFWLCVALAGCSTAPEERQPEATLVARPEFVVAEPAPIFAPNPLPAPAPTPPPITQPAAPVIAKLTPPAAPAPQTNLSPAPVSSRVATAAPPVQIPVSPRPVVTAPVASRAAEPWLSLERWAHAQGLGAPQRVFAEAAPTYSLATSNGILMIRVGSQSAHWNGLEYRLGFAPQLINGQPFIHPLDARKNLEPLINGLSRATKAKPVLVLDPGHGGTDSGSKSALDGHFEKEYTLDWARRLQRLLEAKGWTVFLTRTNDTNISLTNRVTFAERHQADLFLSLHFNSSAPAQTEAGLETYCLTPAGMPSSLTRGYQDNAALVFPNNAFDAPNLQYAVKLHRALLKVNGHLDRGVRRARFLTVLQGQSRPAVLVEGGYLSNPREARRIADPAYRQKLAEALADVLTEESPAVNLASHAPEGVPATARERKID